VQHCQKLLRYLNPFPSNLGEILKRYKRVLVPELNTGQLRFILRGTYLVDVEGYNKVQGKPFLVSELVDKMQDILKT
jgi:2-oxoglutarate/2-oxoacid ferredoxin oxidoreductase subunit alpha